MLSKFEIVIDMPDRVAGKEDVVCPIEGTSVTYSPAFFNNPAVAIITQDMEPGDYYTATDKTSAGSPLRFFNASNTPVEKTFDWVAKGYGYKY